MEIKPNINGQLSEKEILVKMRALRESGDWHKKDKDGNTLGFSDEYSALVNELREITSKNYKMN